MLAELVEKLKEKLDPKSGSNERGRWASARSASAQSRLSDGGSGPWGTNGAINCILGLEGETLAEAQLRRTQEEFATFFQGLNTARVVIEVGTHSAWVEEVIRGAGTKCWWPTRG